MIIDGNSPSVKSTTDSKELEFRLTIKFFGSNKTLHCPILTEKKFGLQDFKDLYKKIGIVHGSVQYKYKLNERKKVLNSDIIRFGKIMRNENDFYYRTFDLYNLPNDLIEKPCVFYPNKINNYLNIHFLDNETNPENWHFDFVDFSHDLHKNKFNIDMRQLQITQN